MRLSIVLIVVVGVLLTGCKTLNIGSGAVPDRFEVTVTVPGGMTGTVSASWRASWVGGTGPFTIEWDFGGGADNIGPVEASSPDAQTVVMRNPDFSSNGTFTYTVTVTDANGLINSATGSYVVSIGHGPPPSITSVVFEYPYLTVDVADPDGDTVHVNVTVDSGLVVDRPSKIAQQAYTGTAIFTISGDDVFYGNTGNAYITASDGGRVSDESVVTCTVPGITLEPGTLYAIPLKVLAGWHEPVRIVVATGAINNFQFLNSCSVCIEHNLDYVPGSFNIGAPGGGRGDADGAWVVMSPSGGFLLPAEEMIVETSIGYLRSRWDFNVTPIGGSNQAGFEGALFNFEVVSGRIGDYHVGLMQHYGVNRTYFSDGADNAYLWDTLMADEHGNLNVTGVDNTFRIGQWWELEAVQ